MIKYVVVSLIYLLAMGLSWREIGSHQAPRHSLWVSVAILTVAWAWMLYSISTVRPASPLEALEDLLLRVPVMRTWLSD